jgi:hypothetical protein
MLVVYTQIAPSFIPHEASRFGHQDFYQQDDWFQDNPAGNPRIKQMLYSLL